MESLRIFKVDTNSKSQKFTLFEHEICYKQRMDSQTILKLFENTATTNCHTVKYNKAERPKIKVTQSTLSLFHVCVILAHNLRGSYEVQIWQI